MKQALNRLALYCAAQGMMVHVGRDGYSMHPSGMLPHHAHTISVDELADRVEAMNSAPVGGGARYLEPGEAWAAVCTLQDMGYTWHGGERWAPPLGKRPAFSAPEFLEKAAGHMRDRAATYDKPEGERSMAQTVAVFNTYHGTRLTEAQGWHFQQILKDVRLFTRPVFHRDSAEDCIAYAALKAEAKANEAANDPTSDVAANA